ncbi:MAG: hypothetical protein WCO98_04110 [bacterium]
MKKILLLLLMMISFTSAFAGSVVRIIPLENTPVYAALEALNNLGAFIPPGVQDFAGLPERNVLLVKADSQEAVDNFIKFVKVIDTKMQLISVKVDLMKVRKTDIDKIEFKPAGGGWLQPNCDISGLLKPATTASSEKNSISVQVLKPAGDAPTSIHMPNDILNFGNLTITSAAILKNGGINISMVTDGKTTIPTVTLSPGKTMVLMSFNGNENKTGTTAQKANVNRQASDSTLQIVFAVTAVVLE